MSVAVRRADGQSSPWLLNEGLPVLLLAVVCFLLHLYSLFHYGHFVDELYYLDCANHLDWGYVDQPPLIGLIAWLVRRTLGDSLAAIRILPAAASVAGVLLAGLLARELGGKRFAQGLAALSVAIAPGLLALNFLFTMNAFEPLFWTGCALVAVRIIRTGNTRLWLWFGALAGLGLQNKYSMAIFGFGLVAGLLLTAQRRLLWSRWFWIAGAIAFLIFLPNLIWNIQHGFPFLELQANIRASGRNVAMPPLTFLAQEGLAILPLSAPIALAGLWFLFFHPAGRAYRVLGWAALFTAVIIMRVNPRVYYFFPVFPVLLAAGGVACERLRERMRWRWPATVYAALMILLGAILAPTLLPLMSPEAYIRYSAATGLDQPRIENHVLGPLPQLFADQFGWREMAVTVGRVYNSLPPEVRPRTAIFTQNYGQAGALNLFGKSLGLPEALSGHQSHFLWGPRQYTGESMIVLDEDREVLERIFSEVTLAGHVSHPYSMPYQHFDVYYCRGMKQPLKSFWPQVKQWS